MNVFVPPTASAFIGAHEQCSVGLDRHHCMAGCVCVEAMPKGLCQRQAILFT
jgi:hypothetical protein